MDTKALKAELTATFPNVKFSVRKTRKNLSVGQVVEIYYNDATLSKDDDITIYWIGQSHQPYFYQVEIFNDAWEWNA
jgi:hypothetical protein